MEYNNTQTQLTKELLDELSREVKEDLFDYLDSIELLHNLTKPDRKKAKDLERDSKGRIIVNLEEPHILENMDYFRQAALHYIEHNVYTRLVPNKHPQSEYVKFWKEESRRCKEGLIRESDGEWIPGYYYFYLNYSPIHITKEVSKEDQDADSDAIRAERIYTFPNVWDSDYWYFHYIEKGEMAGKYGNVLKTRGRGYSFKGGALTVRNLLFYSKSKSYMMASETEYLNKDGIWNKMMDALNWCASNTPFPRARLQDQQGKLTLRLGYKDEYEIERGIRSEVYGVTLKDNPSKARGKRGKVILWEESGKFPGLTTAWGIARMSLEQGRHVFGYMIAFGTGGTEHADFAAAEKFFYSPNGYRILALRNVYDKVKGKGICSFFVPEYLNREGCYDKDGNSDVTAAMIELIEDRLKIKHGTSDPHALTQEKADRPITPQEAVMRKEGTLFPIADLKDYLADISPNMDSFLSPHYVGRLSINKEGSVEFIPDGTIYPIRDYPLKDELNKVGALEIFEHPKRNAMGTIPRGRYISGIDPVDDDYSTTNSLCSMFVMDTFTDKIVAEYTGRPNKANDFYELALRTLKYYNGICNYENDKKGLFAYFNNNHGLQYLCDTPQILKDMDMVKGDSTGNKSKGTNSGKRINEWGRRLQADWLSAQPEIKEEGSKEEESEEHVRILNMHKVRSVGYIRECIHWNIDGNFDRVSAMGMLMILREDMYKTLETRRSEKVKKISQDDFFIRNYDNRKDFSHKGVDLPIMDFES